MLFSEYLTPGVSPACPRVREPDPVGTSRFLAPLRGVKGANIAALAHSASSWSRQWEISVLHPQGLVDHSQCVSIWECDAGRWEVSTLV